MLLNDVPEDSASSYSAAGTPVTGRSISSNASNWGRLACSGCPCMRIGPASALHTKCCVEALC